MKIIGIIPARYASTRFPGKPLVDIAGKSMIQRVYEQVKGCASLAEVIVATDDARIEEHVKSFAGNVLMTSDKHQSGTDRCAEVMNKIAGFDIAINIQGDEPFINPLQIELLCALFEAENTQIGTLVKRIDNTEDLFKESTPKVVLNTAMEAIYFSRHTIPFQQHVAHEKWLENQTYFKHIGIYGYRKDVLAQIPSLPVSALEKAEGLEQLRWIENGYAIKVAETTHDTIAVDHPSDVQNILDSFFK